MFRETKVTDIQLPPVVGPQNPLLNQWLAVGPQKPLVKVNKHDNSETKKEYLTDLKGYHPMITSKLILKNTLSFVEAKDVTQVASCSQSFFTAVKAVSETTPEMKKSISLLKNQILSIRNKLKNIKRSCDCCCYYPDKEKLLIEALQKLDSSIDPFDFEKFKQVCETLKDQKKDIFLSVPVDKETLISFSCGSVSFVSFIFTIVSSFTLPICAPLTSGGTCCVSCGTYLALAERSNNAKCISEIEELCKNTKALLALPPALSMKIQPQTT